MRCSGGEVVRYVTATGTLGAVVSVDARSSGVLVIARKRPSCSTSIGSFCTRSSSGMK